MRFSKYLTEEFEVPHISGKSKITTKIRPEDRSFDNLPRDGKKKAKVKFQKWLEIDAKKANSNHSVTSYGKAANGKWYGWSHRAVYGFGVGDTVGKDTCGNMKETEWVIGTDTEARDQAMSFADDVS